MGPAGLPGAPPPETDTLRPTAAARTRRHIGTPHPPAPARLAILALALLGAAWAYAAPQDEIDALVGAGTPHLALAVVEATQPPYLQDRAGWMAAEEQRLRLLAELGDWTTLAARVADHPDGLPRAFTRHSRTLQAEAMLAGGDGETARGLLRTLIWQHDPGADVDRLGGWRRQVIRSYLADGHHDDAYLAMLRYRQDHGGDNPEFRELTVRVLLQAGRPDAALSALGEADDPAADALRLLASLRAGHKPADAVAAGARKSAGAETRDGDPVAAARYWAIAAEAAAAAENHAEHVAALEAGLPAVELPEREALFVVTPDDLWSAYRRYGEVLGNRAQLLVGQDAAWFELATGSAAKDPLAGRALFAVLMDRGRSPELVSAAHVAFADLLADAKRGALLLRRLYVDGDPGLELQAIPASLRQRIAEQALTDGDPALAARLLGGLDAPPPGGDPFDWRLHRARVLIAGGDRDRGGAELLQLVSRQPERAREQIDAVLPAAADLRAAGSHAPAIAVLKSLAALDGLDTERRRQLLALLGDAYRADGRPLEAARQHLRSATLADPAAMDAPARASRLEAARALTEAGLVADARNLLQGLLAGTRNKKQRAVIEHELQRLRLQD